MTVRHLFGASAADYAYQTNTIDGVANVMSVAGGLTVTWWSAQSGGAQYTDLSADRDGANPVTTSATADADDGPPLGSLLPVYGPAGVWMMWAQVADGPRLMVISSDVGTQMGPTVDTMSTTLTGHIATAGNPHSTRMDDLVDVAAATPADGYTLIYRTGSGAWVAEAPAAGGGSASTLQMQVTADGVTDVAPTIQAALDALGSSSRPRHVIVEGTTKGTIYLNGKVRITTDHTRVTFAAPVKFGTGIDPDGYGGLSILGTAGTATTISSGATRGSSQVVVASTTGLAARGMVRIYDNDTTGGTSAGNKTEMAEIIYLSGTTVFLDRPLSHTYTGTINLQPITPVINSGFDGVTATFSGQQAANFLFPTKIQYGVRCYMRNVHLRGDYTNSWSREAFNIKWSLDCLYDNCSASVGWNYSIGSTYNYGFSSDGSTGITWRSCVTNNLRHGFSADKGSNKLMYLGCYAHNTTASGFDLHGGRVADITYVMCEATASVTRSAADNTRCGFLAGNTTFTNGAHFITYVGCVARNFGPYTSSGGGTGDGSGFGVVDGSSNITIQACRIIECQNGVKILSQVGVPITNVSIMGCEFNGIAGGSIALPIWVTAGIAPNDVDGLTIQGNMFVNCSGMADLRIRGNSGNQLANIRVVNNTWIGQGVASQYPLDIRYVDNPIVVGNTFDRTRRGVALTASPNALVARNTFYKLTDGADASRIILDSGGANTNLHFVDNTISGFTPTSWGTAITSTGASVTKPAAGVAIV